MIRKLHHRLKERTLTAEALTKEYLDTIAKKEKTSGAYLRLLEESAYETARAVDGKIARGEAIDLLAGIPGAVKDNICIQGTRTSAASRILDNYVAPYSATVIEKLTEKQAIILGKTNLDEFAMGSSTENSAYQKTANPWHPDFVPGGSSGGSAAAVAAGEAVWSLGSDTGGSIRQPASFCGLVGLKPTYGRVSRSGLIAMASSLDQIGPLATTVEDVAIVFSRIAGEDSLDATTAPLPYKPFEDYLEGQVAGLRIGLPKEYWNESLAPTVREKAQAALERFRSLGMEVVDISLPHSELALPVYYILTFSEISSNLARFDGIKYGLSINNADEKEARQKTGGLLQTYLDSRGSGFGPEVKRRIMLGTHALSSGYYDAYYKKAQIVRELIKEDFEKAFEKVDLIFSPTTPGPAFRFGEKTKSPLQMYLSDIYTVSANLAGLPALSFPMGTLSEGPESGVALPLGGQLMAKWYDEETLLRAAQAFEKSTLS